MCGLRRHHCPDAYSSLVMNSRQQSGLVVLDSKDRRWTGDLSSRRGHSAVVHQALGLDVLTAHHHGSRSNAPRRQQWEGMVCIHRGMTVRKSVVRKWIGVVR